MTSAPPGPCPRPSRCWTGAIHVGLERGRAGSPGADQGALKLSRADLAVALAMGATGATTVAATMICAARAGIGVFATGGIGGVHRGAETASTYPPILQELAQTPVTVVAAGAKAILDLPKTLEVLETLGVPVIAHGQDEFPAFWSRDSGLPAPLRMDDAGQIARAHQLRGRFGPARRASWSPTRSRRPTKSPRCDRWLDRAGAGDCAGVAAKEVTPRLLARIYELSDGASLTANIALVRNNARLGAAIARALVSDSHAPHIDEVTRLQRTDRMSSDHHKRGVLGSIRSNFLAGLAVIAPGVLTVWLVWNVVTWIDGIVMPLIPARFHPRC